MEGIRIKYNLEVFRKGIIFIIVALVIFWGFPTESYVLGNENKNETKKIIPSYDFWYQSATSYSLEGLNRNKIPREAKALYITGNTASNQKLESIMNVLAQSELNSLVIDVKEDSGYVTYKSNVPEVKEITSDRKNFIYDVDGLLKRMKENNIYTIARIVTFKDPFYAGAKPEIAMQKKEGGVWRDRGGVSWVDPYLKEVWDYNIAIAKEAAGKGFNEIQFDYVRFPENGAKVDREVTFINPENRTKAQNIADFLAYAKEELKDYPIFISADVFGLTTTVIDDMGIGQQWELITQTVDYISPMMYPSHYANRTYGLPVPDAYPYETIKFGLQDAIKKNDKLLKEGKKVAVIRPWYQDFSASWVPGYIIYGSKEVKAQIQAGYDIGIKEYIMWSSKNNYSYGAWIN